MKCRTQIFNKVLMLFWIWRIKFMSEKWKNLIASDRRLQCEDERCDPLSAGLPMSLLLG